jgi:hypothetical protein
LALLIVGISLIALWKSDRRGLLKLRIFVVIAPIFSGRSLELFAMLKEMLTWISG